MNTFYLLVYPQAREVEGRRKVFPLLFLPHPRVFLSSHFHVTKTLSLFPFFRVHLPFSASTICTSRIHAYLIDRVFNLTDESCSRCEGLKNERDSARRQNQTLEKKIQEWRSVSEDYQRENQELQENLKSVKEEHGILQLSSRELEATKEEQQQKIRQLQRENTELGDKVTKQTSEYLEEVKAERSKCDELRKKVKTLREMPGRKCFVQLLPHCRPRYKNLDFVWDF